jgi:hypothetical protein
MMQLMMMSMIDGCTNKRKRNTDKTADEDEKMIRLVDFMF